MRWVAERGRDGAPGRVVPVYCVDPRHWGVLPHGFPKTGVHRARFLLASLASKDRLSLVTFEVGMGGRVRRTPFLSVGKPGSRQRLSKFIEDIGRREEFGDEFLVRGSSDEKTDVVTAVNNGTSCRLARDV